MNELLDSVVSKRNTIQHVKIYFGNSKNSGSNILDCNVSNDIVDKCLSQFIGYSNTKNEFKHIVALDKELFITKKDTVCKQILIDECNFSKIPNSDNQVCIMTEKVNSLSEINFPSKKKYNNISNCMEYIFNIHAKVQLVVRIENNTNSVFLDATVDDYIDTTIQYLKDGIIQTIATFIK